MTIIIAAKTIPPDYIVTVSDRMISRGGMVQATDNATVKTRRIAESWGLMFSATNANLFLPIMKQTCNELGDFKQRYSVETVTEAVSQAYIKIFDKLVTSTYLAQFDYNSISNFRSNGLKELGPEITERIFNTINQFDVGVSLLGYGFDADDQPHIFQVESPGVVIDHDLLGYAAIGSGETMAEASLCRKHLTGDFESTIYRLLEAKFCAETAPGVGRSTTVVTMNAKGETGWITSRAHGSPGEIEQIRSIWEETLRDPDPPSAINIIKKSHAVKGVCHEDR